MKNKKLLLIASASVLAAGVATAGVASFAWFQAAEAAKIENTSALVDAITVSKVETITSATEIDCDFTINEVDANPSDLQLAHWAGSAFEYKAYDANGTLQNVSLATGCVTVRAYAIKVATNLTADQKTALAGSSVTMTVMTGASVSNRVVVRLSEPALTSGNTWVASPATELTVTPASWNQNTTIAYCAIYIEGAVGAAAESSPIEGLAFGLNFTGAVA